jgi:hypothetical protein
MAASWAPAFNYRVPNFTGLADEYGVVRPGMRSLRLPGLSYGAPAYESYLSNEGVPALQGYENQARSGLFGYNTPPTGLAGGAIGGAGATATNPFSTLTNIKNPNVQAGVNTILSSIGNLETNPNVNTNVLKRNVRSEPLASRIGGQYQSLDQQIKDNSQSIADFVNSYRQSQPEAQGYQQQESANIGQYYGAAPGQPSPFLNELNRLDANTSAAAMQAAQRAVGQAARQANSARLLGNDTYVDKNLADTIAAIRVGEALRRGEAAKGNFQTASQAALNLTGARGNLLENLLRRNMLPTQFAQQIRAGDLAQLSQLGGLENANTQYTLDSPEALLARRAGLLNDTSGIDLRNNFYGLSKPYEPNYEGGGPIARPRGRTPFDYPVSPVGEPPTYDAATGRPLPPSPTSAAERLYQRTSGANPNSDPNFSAELWRWAMDQTRPGIAQMTPNISDWSQFQPGIPGSLSELPSYNPYVDYSGYA